MIQPNHAPTDAAARTSGEWQTLAHRLIPGGAHTYAKGDDQYPTNAPAVIERGFGSHIWDADGREYIEYGSGLRSVTLGHAFPRVVEVVRRQLEFGANFNRPSTIEIETASELLELFPGAEMVKFSKNASDCTTAAIKLARACTGRDYVAFCRDQPFFSTDDWFIGTTPIERLFAEYPQAISCVMLEPATVVLPDEGYLQAVREICDRHGALLVFDETITGFRWSLGGGQEFYGIVPDLSIFGKALGNGFAVSALVGKADYMRRGGLDHDAQRVFLLSTTHGAETHSLAAAREVIRTYREEPVIETIWRQGERLRAGFNAAVAEYRLENHVRLLGPPCNLIYETRDDSGERSQAFRALFMQELIAGGVLAPSLVVGYSHYDEDIDRTICAIENALCVYSQALAGGVEHFLAGRPVKPVFRAYN
jgi:glutamate-1-semialdehyde 2,1-aminomutase